MHWNYISPFLIAWQYASYLRKIACFHCHLFTDKLFYRLWWNNLAIFFSKAHKEKTNTLFPAHLWFQPLPLARKNSPSHLLQKERGKIYFRWCKKVRTEHIQKNQSTVEQRKRNLGHLKRLKTEKDTLERKEGNLCLVAVARRKLSMNCTSAGLQLVFQPPTWEDLEDLEEDLVFLWEQVQNPFLVKSNHQQESKNIYGNAPDLPQKVVHSWKVWRVSKELKRTAKGTDSTKTGSWNSEN